MNNLTIDIKSVKRFAKYKRKLTNVLASLSNKHMVVYPTQEWLAKQVGCTPQWISKLTTELHNEGFLHKLYRHMTSCVYTLNPSLFIFEVRQSLKDFLPALSWIPLSVGMLICTQPIKSLNDIYKGNISYRSLEKNSGDSMSVVIKKVVEKYGFNGYQQEQLETYPDSVILEADRIVSKSTTVNDKIGYFFGICRNKLANPSSFKPNGRTTETVSGYVSDNRHWLKETTTTTKLPIHNEWKPKILSADERKELRLKGKIKDRERDEYIRSVSRSYGETIQSVKEIDGFMALGSILSQHIQPFINPVADKLNEDDQWLLMQQPMDIEDYDSL